MIPAKSQVVDGSFGTLHTKRSFQIHMFLLHWTILFSGWMDLFSVTYYFLSTVTLKDLFPVYKKIFLMSRIYFCPLSHDQNYPSIGKRSFIVTYYFLSTVTCTDLFFRSERSFTCHVLFFVHCHVSKRSFQGHVSFFFTKSHRSVWGPYFKEIQSVFFFQTFTSVLKPVHLHYIKKSQSRLSMTDSAYHLSHIHQCI